MLKSMAAVLVALVAAMPSPGNADAPRIASAVGGYWVDGERGWFWYEDPVIELPEKPTRETVPKEEPKAAKKQAKAPELVQFEQLKQRLEDLRNIAIITRSERDVRRYMELEAVVVSMASEFADVAQRVAWASPELDPTLVGRPVNAKALEVFDLEQAQGRARSIGELGKDHVLLFFFRSDCPYCHAFAPTLEAFQARYGMMVVPISVDGGGLPSFPEPRVDNGISRTLNVTQVPAVYLAQPFSGTITPIGFGVLSESQLLERISTVSTPASAAMVPSITRHVPVGLEGLQ